MATPPRVSEDALTQRHYLTQLALSAALIQAVREMWAATQPSKSPDALRSFREGMFVLVTQFSQAAISLAADYYADARRNAGISGTPQLTLVPSPPQSLVDAGIDWGARAPGSDADTRFLDRVEDAMQKAVLDTSRAQVIASVASDDLALGFRRVARPDACAWCLTLTMRRSTRGATGDQHVGVYKTRESAGQILSPNTLGEVNRYHDNCHCGVQPVFAIGDTGLPAWMADMQRLYETSTKDSRSGDRLNAFRRALAALRNGESTASPLPELPPLVDQRERLNLLAGLLADFGA